MNASLRIRAVGMLVLLLLVAVLGGELAGESSYTWPYLAAHIVLAVLLIGFSAHVFMAAIRGAKAPAKVGAGVAFVSAVGATISGTVFLLGGSNPIALDGMEGLAIVAVVGILLILIWGSRVAPSDPATPG